MEAYQLKNRGLPHCEVRKNRAFDFFGIGEMDELEKNLAAYARSQSIPYAFTLFSGAERIAPYARYNRGFVYVEEKYVVDMTKALGWKEVSSGANFTLMVPYYSDVIENPREIAGAKVIDDFQLYLDLAGFKGRGEDAAQFILEQRIKPIW